MKKELTTSELVLMIDKINYEEDCMKEFEFYEKYFINEMFSDKTPLELIEMTSHDDFDLNDEYFVYSDDKIVSFSNDEINKTLKNNSNRIVSNYKRLLENDRKMASEDDLAVLNQYRVIDNFTNESYIANFYDLSDLAKNVISKMIIEVESNRDKQTYKNKDFTDIEEVVETLESALIFVEKF